MIAGYAQHPRHLFVPMLGIVTTIGARHGHTCNSDARLRQCVFETTKFCFVIVPYGPDRPPKPTSPVELAGFGLESED